MKLKTEIRGRNIAYTLLGQESVPAVVLGHALGSNSDIWGYQLPLLTAQFRVLIYDLPGHGESDPPIAQDSFDDLANDLATLLDHTGVSRATLVGLSIGGMIAQHFASLFPDRLQALVLCSTGFQTDEAGKKIFGSRIAQVSEGGVETQVEGSMSRWFTPQFVSDAPATIEWVKGMYRKTSPAGFINACRAIQELDTLNRLASITAPTLLIPGELDPAFPVSVSRSMQSQIKNAELKVLAGAAHIGNVERPHEFNEIVFKFLAEVVPQN
jgi:3-oxoadipate enol-lactonase